MMITALSLIIDKDCFSDVLIDENVAADTTSSATSVQAVGSSIGCGDDTSSIQTLSIDLSKSHSLCRMITISGI